MVAALRVDAPVRGCQTPRVLSAPTGVGSSAEACFGLAEMVGLELDPWQKLVLRHGLEETAAGKFAATEVGLIVPRQNGKGAIESARALVGIFALNERLIIHSAHEFPTAVEACNRLEELLKRSPELWSLVKRVSRSHGAEGIFFKSGQRILFKTRTKGGGRGFTADCLILDEAMVLPDAFLGALMPTLSAIANPQLWYAGSAVDEDVHEHGLVLTRLRERGMKGNDPALAFFEWSVTKEQLAASNATDIELWAIANPGLGYRLSPEFTTIEQRSMTPRTFEVERLGIGRWPSTDPEGDRVISAAKWAALSDPYAGDPMRRSQIVGPTTFGIDVRPDRTYAAIVACGSNAAGKHHVEVIEHKTGTSWIVDRCAELHERHGNSLFVVDEGGPAAGAIPGLEAIRRLKLMTVSGQKYAQACAYLLDSVNDVMVTFPPPQPELDQAVASAKTRALSDAWAWSRKNSEGDISPLVACTLAVYGNENRPKRSAGRVVNLAEALRNASENGG